MCEDSGDVQSGADVSMPIMTLHVTAGRSHSVVYSLLIRDLKLIGQPHI